MTPNFLVLGAEKAGTTWMYHALAEHPDIYLPPTKECHFFNKYNSNLQVADYYRNRGWAWYRQFFRNAPPDVRAIGEVTPMYLCDPEAPGRIAEDLPEVKMIYILRNPIERAYSHYWMAYRKGHVDKSFENVVADRDPRFIERGKYEKQLERYYDLFSSSQLKGYIFEHFFKNPERGLKNLQVFLEVNPRNLNSGDSEERISGAVKPRSQRMYNFIAGVAHWMRTYRLTFKLLDWVKRLGIAPAVKQWNLDSVPYPPMSESMYYRLLEYYADDIEQLEKQFDFNLECWKTYNT